MVPSPAGAVVPSGGSGQAALSPTSPSAEDDESLFDKIVKTSQFITELGGIIGFFSMVLEEVLRRFFKIEVTGLLDYLAPLIQSFINHSWSKYVLAALVIGALIQSILCCMGRSHGDNLDVEALPYYFKFLRREAAEKMLLEKEHG